MAVQWWWWRENKSNVVVIMVVVVVAAEGKQKKCGGVGGIQLQYLRSCVEMKSECGVYVGLGLGR